MWMPLLKGEHVSTDAAVIDGEPVWWRHTVGNTLDQGMFDYWVISGGSASRYRRVLRDWLRSRLKGYTGCVNFETIGAKIIEAPALRRPVARPVWPGWIEAVVDLYASGRWDFCDDARTGYSIVLFGAHGTRYTKPDQGTMNEFLSWQGISSIQMTFHEDRARNALDAARRIQTRHH